MAFFSWKTQALAVEKPRTVEKPPVLEGWSENELVSVYNAAPVRHLRAGETFLSDLEASESFFVLIDGCVQVVVKWKNLMGRPGMIRRGDCIAPLPKSPGLLYCGQAVEPSTLIEITPTILNHLSFGTQLSIYKVAMTTTSRINAYIRAVNGEVTWKNASLSSYIARCETRRATSDTGRVREFISNIPRLPEHATDLAMKLLQETTSVQEVVEGLKQDPNTAGLVLRAVNSAQFGFNKKIETFYHACIILGFNSIYSLIMRDAVQSAIVVSEEAELLHTHACLASALCYEISLCSRDVHGQTATTVGLLHDIGKGIQILMKRARWLMDEYVDALDPARLGADLLRSWGLPERLCSIIENQRMPEFTAPDLVPAEYRRDAGVLHVAHVLESLLRGGHEEPGAAIFTTDYMAMLGIQNLAPADLLSQRVLPSLRRNAHRLPREIQSFVLA